MRARDLLEGAAWGSLFAALLAGWILLLTPVPATLVENPVNGPVRVLSEVER